MARTDKPSRRRVGESRDAVNFLVKKPVRVARVKVDDPPESSTDQRADDRPRARLPVEDTFANETAGWNIAR